MPTLTADIEHDYVPAGGIFTSVAYPKIAITYRHSPGCAAFTYPGEYAPTDPPESPEVEFESASLVDADGIDPPPTAAMIDRWGRDYIASDAGYRHACNEADQWGGHDPDDARDMKLEDDRLDRLSGQSWDDEF